MFFFLLTRNKLPKEKKHTHTQIQVQHTSTEFLFFETVDGMRDQLEWQLKIERNHLHMSLSLCKIAKVKRYECFLE